VSQRYPAEPGAGEPTLSLSAWMDRLRAALSVDGEAATDLSADEQRLILELARVAAHTSERIAAPLTTFVAGLALAGLAREERVRRLREFLETLRD
jgi:uncharacterized membrane-anchored protein